MYILLVMGQALFQFKHVKALPKFVELDVCPIKFDITTCKLIKYNRVVVNRHVNTLKLTVHKNCH